MKKNDKTPKSKTTDSERETIVLLERMHSDIQRIAETQSSTTARIAEIKADMPTKSEVNTISMAVMSLSGDIKTLQNDVKNIDTRLKTVEEKLDKNLDNHEKRITKLEEKVFV